ncbi:MAG: 3-phosphoshikimate 1-carboxyvinyltransferase, partial [Cyanobacteria bacterium]|nr:3-phosphoshikimate 1-carboxyvinyltransferase [Cyanobacteriota bacterium]
QFDLIILDTPPTKHAIDFLLAPQKLYCVLTGDESLRKRPMSRVINPIRKMGGIIQGRQQDTLSPLTILPSPKELEGIEYTPPHASAQVKSCLLLAGLFAKGRTTVIEPIPTRDHTERMFHHMGIPLTINTRSTLEKQITLEEGAISAIQGQDWVIPGDFSSAAFFMVAALIIPGSEICIQQVNMNPSRIGLLKVLLKMGAKIQIENQAFLCGEPVADIVVQSSHLKGDIWVTPEEIPDLIDEIPIMAIAALFLEGSLTIQGAEDLRKKESDRINALFQNFYQLDLDKHGKPLGIHLEEFPDGMKIHGSPDLAHHPGLASGRTIEEQMNSNSSNLLASFHDHRIVMSFLILKHICQAHQPNQPIDWEIDGMDWINTSFPGFMNQLKRLTQ